MVDIKNLDCSNMDKKAKKAIDYYVKKNKLNSVYDVPLIEPYFFEQNNFIPKKSI